MAHPTVGDWHGRLEHELPGWASSVVTDAAAALAHDASSVGGSTDRQAAADAAALLHEAAPRLARGFAMALQAALRAPAAATGEQVNADAPDGLSLVDEDQIDADIETFRIARAAEDATEAELRHLAPLASALQQRDGVHADAVPLSPPACARALRQALAALAPPRERRPRLLGALGAAMAGRLGALYASQIRLLESWNVAPARYRIRQTVSAAGNAAPAGAPAAAAGNGAPLSPDLVAALNRLVAWAQRQPGADAPATEAGLLRLFDEPSSMPGDLSAAPRRLPRAVARQLMQHLFDQVERQAGEGATPAWIAPMKGAGDRLAAQSAEVFNDFQHPWWQLLDRLVALTALPSGSLGDVDRAIADTLDRLQSSTGLARRDVAAAVAQIDLATTDWLEQQQDEVGAQAASLADSAERQQLEDAIREQLVARMRSEPTPDGLRRFLLGPWALAMADAALRGGTESQVLQAQADCLEQLLAAGRAPLASVERRLLLTSVRLALESAQLDAPRIDAELLDLAAVLHRPEPPSERLAEPTAPRDTAPLDLATVPIDMYEQDAGVDREAWLASLRRGAHCRLYLNGRWHTASLAWVSPHRGLFVFGSSRGAGVLSLRRRALEKLRNAGLATSVLPGELLAEALDRVTDLGELGEL
jgi:hypothetical protein